MVLGIVISMIFPVFDLHQDKVILLEKWVCSYLYKMKHGMSHFGTLGPDFYDIHSLDYDWEAT
jgi:hypothetical protein